jgi:hypothetical protein
MTQPFDDEYGERIRRALHAEAEAVTPSAEGLERIRTKINQRHERRFGWFAYSAPWLRPLAAVTAALAVCFAAVSVTPALANFVQTGHFSFDSGTDDGSAVTNDGRSHGQVLPGESSAPFSSTSPSPSAVHPSTTGKHVVRGSCPPGENTVSPTSSPPPGSGPAPTVTCQAPPVTGGGGGDDSTSPPPADPGTPPASSAPEEPPTDPTSESSPGESNPNQSP